nr:MAG TPA: hypothetical protein [Caudoviricetes sp.]
MHKQGPQKRLQWIDTHQEELAEWRTRPIE